MNERESSGVRYARELEAAIRSGERVDPDLWLNPITDQIELRPDVEGGGNLGDKAPLTQALS